jgi:hypothetical protein
MKQRLRLLFVVFVLGFVGITASAQSPIGSIEGVITDPGKAVVAGATVTLTSSATGQSFTATTNDDGFFTFRSLQPGAYSIKVEQKGFSTATASNIVVQVNQVARADISLKVGAPTETVQVDVGATELQVDTSRQTVDGVISGRQITQLPLNDRNFLDLAALQPSVSVVDGGVIDPTKVNTFRSVRVNGGSGTGTRVQIEGIDVTDETVGTTVANFSTDAVQEFNLQRSSFDLSTSLTTSGAISIASRTGSNRFAGSGFYFKQDNLFDARPGFSETKPEFNRAQYGYRFGGPIIKDKLFFFSNAERLDQADFNSFGSTNFPQFNTESTLPLKTFNTLQRLDYNLTDKIRLFYLFNHSDDSSSGGNLYSPFQNVDWTNIHGAGLNMSGAKTTHEIRFGYVNFNNRIESQELSGFEFYRAPGGTALQVNVGDLSWGPNTLAPQQTYQDNVQFKYNGSIVLGKHIFRYGADVTRIDLGGFANFSGPLAVGGDVNTCTNPADPVTCQITGVALGPNSGFFTARPGHGLPFGDKKDTRFSWYVGDQWKVLRNLTLNLGLRHNYDTHFFDGPGVRELTGLSVYSPGLGVPAKYPKDAFSPQVGFAWDPFGNGKNSIRGGFYLAYEGNIFNNSIFDENARNAPGIGPLGFAQGEVLGPDGSPIVVNGIPGCDPAQTAMGNYDCLLNFTIANGAQYVELLNNALQAAYSNLSNYDPNAGPSNWDLSPGGLAVPFPADYKLPYSMQFNIGFQREIAKGHVLSVDYVRQRGVGLPLQILNLENRRDVSTFNETAARSRISAVTGIAPADINPTTIGTWLATHPTATIATFGLSGDDVWTGTTTTRNNGQVIRGGFSLYQALQVSLVGRFTGAFLKPLSIDGHSFFRDLSYTVGYAFGRNKSTGGGSRPEFLATALCNRDFNSCFGPNGLDRRHNLTVSASLGLIGGFRLDQIYRLTTSPPVSFTVPNSSALANGISGANGIFTVDFNGDGGNGTTPRADFLPGTGPGSFGTALNNIEALNAVIAAYNANVAGHITPHGARLVAAGLFTEAQLIALRAKSPALALVPTDNPNPFHTRFNADYRISRPIKIWKETWLLEPSFSVFNVFNNNAPGTYGGLGGTCGSLNYNYSVDPSDCGDTGSPNPAAALAALRESRGLIFRRRQLQFGIRFTF